MGKVSNIINTFMIKLGEILLQDTNLTVNQLEEGLAIQKEKGGLIGEILLQKKYITEDELLKSLGKQLGMLYLSDVPKEEIDVSLLSEIPITFAKTYKILPLYKENNSVIVATANPLDIYILDDIGIILKSVVKPVLVSPNKIEDIINFAYDKFSAEDYKKEMMDGIDEDIDLGHALDHIEESEDILDQDEDAPIIRFVNTILVRAVKERASDIHIEAFEKELSVRFRIDGVLYEIVKPPKKFHSSIIARIKVMANLNIAEKRLPQDGRIKIKIAGKEVDIRTSVIPAAFGERVVMRILDKTGMILKMEDLGLVGERLKIMNELITKSHGIILVTGPTGCGKTTTLYAALGKINSPDKNILTVEDPIEYQIKGIGQMQVNPKINLTFASGLRSFLRQDPDVIMVGEIRDLETAEIAIQASLTGHLVFSTLHTNDACGAITRLIEMGVEPFLVSSSVLAVLAQRLVRVLCPNCKIPYVPDDFLLQKLEIKKEELNNGVIYKAGGGCEVCQNKTGYMGRTGIFELFLINDKIRSLIMKNADSNTIKKAAIADGMKTLREDGVSKVIQGITSVEEIFKATQEDTFEYSSYKETTYKETTIAA